MTSDARDFDQARTVEVVLRRFPLGLAARATEQYEGLLREFALLAASTSMDDDAVPTRLLALIDALGRRFPRQDAHEEERRDLLARGKVEADLSLKVAVSAGEASRTLDRMFDEAEEFCRSGELLTLAAEPDIVAFRHWYLDEVTRQVGGAEPAPWPGSLE